jgi:hypothetical protein
MPAVYMSRRSGYMRTAAKMHESPDGVRAPVP